MTLLEFHWTKHEYRLKFFYCLYSQIMGEWTEYPSLLFFYRHKQQNSYLKEISRTIKLDFHGQITFEEVNALGNRIVLSCHHIRMRAGDYFRGLSHILYNHYAHFSRNELHCQSIYQKALKSNLRHLNINPVHYNQGNLFFFYDYQMFSN